MTKPTLRIRQFGTLPTLERKAFQLLYDTLRAHHPSYEFAPLSQFRFRQLCPEGRFHPLQADGTHSGKVLNLFTFTSYSPKDSHDANSVQLRPMTSQIVSAGPIDWLGDQVAMQINTQYENSLTTPPLDILSPIAYPTYIPRHLFTTRLERTVRTMRRLLPW